LCCHPSLVAIASSNEAFEYPVSGTGLEVKTNELEKSYKENGGSGSETPWSDQLWREKKSRAIMPDRIYSGAVSLGTIAPG
jgi:hypothetical protein